MATKEALRDYYLDKIHENGFVSVEFDISGSDIDPLFAAFRGVLHEVYERPSEAGRRIIEALAVETPGRPLDSKGFIEQRRLGRISTYEIGRDPATENKDQMHFTPRTYLNAASYFYGKGGVPRVLRTLLDQCTEVQEAVKRSVRPVAQALGFEELIFAPKGRETDNVHMLRILRYLPTDSVKGGEPVISRRDALAELHFDRSKFTGCVWESAPGLVGAPGNNGLGDQSLTVDELDVTAEKALNSPIKHTSNRLKLFAGAGYNRMPAEYQEASGNLPLLLHGVVDANPGKERDAVVCFINEHAGVTSCSVPPKTETGLSSVRQSVLDRQRRYGGLAV